MEMNICPVCIKPLVADEKLTTPQELCSCRPHIIGEKQ
jgi:hypothetical protein